MMIDRVNTLVLSAKFETADYRDIQRYMYELDKDIQQLLTEADGMPSSEYVEGVVRIHHRLTVIHAFRDGNGRTSRAFLNMMPLKRHIPPVFFKDNAKDAYKDSLGETDRTGKFDSLYEVFYKALLTSNAALSDFKY